MAIFGNAAARRAARRDYLRDIWESFQEGRSARTQSRQWGRTTRKGMKQKGKTDRRALKELGGVPPIFQSPNGTQSTVGPLNGTGNFLDSPMFWPALLVGFGALFFFKGNKDKRREK